MIYYFTGTGNSLWTARQIGENVGQSVKSILVHKNDAQISCNDAVVGFVFPTYMGDIPWITKEFLLKLRLLPDSYIFLVMTSNNGESGKAFRNLDQALSLSNATLSAGFNLQMPGNCLISTEEENAERLQRAPVALERICAAIKQKHRNFTSDGSRPAADFVTGSYFYGEHSLKRLTLMKNFSITNSCNGCGICAAVCPERNVQIKSGKAFHGHVCAACYACLHWCPQNATLLNVPTLKHRPQYHHPKIQLSDIADAAQL